MYNLCGKIQWAIAKRIIVTQSFESKEYSMAWNMGMHSYNWNGHLKLRLCSGIDGQQKVEKSESDLEIRYLN